MRRSLWRPATVGVSPSASWGGRCPAERRVVVGRPALGEHPGQGHERAADDRPGDGLAHLHVGVGGVLRRVLAGRGPPAGVEGLLGQRCRAQRGDEGEDGPDLARAGVSHAGRLSATAGQSRRSPGSRCGQVLGVAAAHQPVRRGVAVVADGHPHGPLEVGAEQQVGAGVGLRPGHPAGRGGVERLGAAEELAGDPGPAGAQPAVLDVDARARRSPRKSSRPSPAAGPPWPTRPRRPGSPPRRPARRSRPASCPGPTSGTARSAARGGRRGVDRIRARAPNHPAGR